MKVNGTLVKQYRSQLGMTQEELAKKAGYDTRTISRIEKHNNAKLDTIKDVAEALKAPVEELKLKVRTNIFKTNGVNPSNKPAVFIPASAPIPNQALLFAHTDSILQLPLGGKPIFLRSLEYLQSLGLTEFSYGVSKRIRQLEELARLFTPEASVVFNEEPKPQSVGHTLYYLLNEYKGNARSALVVLGDTHFHYKDTRALFTSKTPVALWNNVNDSYRWALIKKKHKDAEQYHFIEKGQQEISYEMDDVDYRALIGVYFFPDINKLKDVLENLNPQEMAKIEMTDILHEFKGVKIKKADEWFDVGHADMHMKANASYLRGNRFGARQCNTVRLDEVNNLIIKTASKNADDNEREKLCREIDYYSLLPHELNIYFPRVMSSASTWSNPHIELEYICYPPLSDLFLFGNMHPETWRHVFITLKRVFDRFSDEKYMRPKNDSILKNMYFTKTQDRLKTLNSQLKTMAGRLNPHQEIMKELLNNDNTGITADGLELTDLSNMVTDHEDAIMQVIESCESFTIVHGDFNIANVLYDLPSATVRMIDPRGTWGGCNGIYGDPIYDWAKIIHSVAGLYDSIVKDLFTITPSNDHNETEPNIALQKIANCGGNLSLSIYKPAYHEEIVSACRSVFEKTFDDRWWDVMLLNAMLFSSMIPLHRDYPERQLAMYIVAHHFFKAYTEHKPLEI